MDRIYDNSRLVSLMIKSVISCKEDKSIINNSIEGEKRNIINKYQILENSERILYCDRADGFYSLESKNFARIIFYSFLVQELFQKYLIYSQEDKPDFPLFKKFKTHYVNIIEYLESKDNGVFVVGGDRNHRYVEIDKESIIEIIENGYMFDDWVEILYYYHVPDDLKHYIEKPDRIWIANNDDEVIEYYCTLFNGIIDFDYLWSAITNDLNQFIKRLPGLYSSVNDREPHSHHDLLNQPDLVYKSAIKKIMLLNELGIFDNLRTKYNLSNEMIANIFAGITNENKSTIANVLNEINTGKKNDPYNSDNNKTWLNHELLRRKIEIK